MTSSVSFASVSGRRRSITNLSLSSCACRGLSPTQSCGEGQCTYALGEFRESEHDSFMAAIQNGHTTACRTLPQDEESHFLPQKHHPSACEHRTLQQVYHWQGCLTCLQVLLQFLPHNRKFCAYDSSTAARADKVLVGECKLIGGARLRYRFTAYSNTFNTCHEDCTRGRLICTLPHE